MRTFLLILAFFIWTICKAETLEKDSIIPKVYEATIDKSTKKFIDRKDSIYYDLNRQIFSKSELQKHKMYIKCIYYGNSLVKSEKIILQ